MKSQENLPTGVPAIARRGSRNHALDHDKPPARAIDSFAGVCELEFSRELSVIAHKLDIAGKSGWLGHGGHARGPGACNHEHGRRRRPNDISPDTPVP